jgi:hypothetical protein
MLEELQLVAIGRMEPLGAKILKDRETRVSSLNAISSSTLLDIG